MYGIGKTWADALRLLKGGRLLSTKDQAERGELEEDEKQYGDKDFPAVNNIRLPMANPPPPRDHYLKNVKRFFRELFYHDCFYRKYYGGHHAVLGGTITENEDGVLTIFFAYS